MDATNCAFCSTATSRLRAATGDSKVVAWCTMHACPVVVGQQRGPGPGLFIVCGQPHTVGEHQAVQSGETGGTDG